MMTDTGISLSDIAAVTKDHDQDGYGYYMNNPFIYLVWMFMARMFGGWGYNENGNVATQADVQRAFDTNTVVQKLDGLSNGLCDGFYAVNTGMLNGFNGIQRDLCTGFNAINSGIAENRFAAQQCCCETNRNIDAVRYENAKNTCDITNAIHCEGEATRALINANMVQDLRDRLEQRDRDLMTANFQLSQQAQNATLINTLKPCPIPAYITCSPYATTTNNCGCAGYTNFS